MTNEQGLVERLRDDARAFTRRFGIEPERSIGWEAADSLEAQAAENAELRAEVERLECRNIEHEMRFDAEEAKADHWKAHALAAETALATAREDAKGREGWKLVPIEPTERMIEMARTCIKRLPEDQRARLLFEDWRTTHGIKMRARWAAMLSASPLSQGGQADG